MKDNKNNTNTTNTNDIYLHAIIQDIGMDDDHDPLDDLLTIPSLKMGDANKNNERR